MEVDQTASVFFVSAGVTNRLDLTVFVPVLAVTATADNQVVVDHGNGTSERFPRYDTRGSSSGLGDVDFRAKYRATNQRGGGLALVGDLRVPTGDKENLLGLGTMQVKIGALYSAELRRLAPHANVSFVATPRREIHPFAVGSLELRRQTELNAVFGAEATPDPKVTVSADVLYRHLPSGGRLEYVQLGAPDLSAPQRLVLKDVGSTSWSFGAAVKVNVANKLLIGGSVLVSLNDSGLRDKITPGLQVEYSF